jgi:gamma-butyrobetaine dioxygenase
MNEELPEAYALLRQVQIPWHFHDQDYDILQHRSIICHNAKGELEYFAFDAHIVAVPDLDADSLYRFYSAYQRLMLRVQDPKYAVQIGLRPGQMAVYNNLRVLHESSAFDSTFGERHYRGYYIDGNEIDSQIRVLARNAM